MIIVKWFCDPPSKISIDLYNTRAPCTSWHHPATNTHSSHACTNKNSKRNKKVSHIFFEENTLFEDRNEKEMAYQNPRLNRHPPLPSLSLPAPPLKPCSTPCHPMHTHKGTKTLSPPPPRCGPSITLIYVYIAAVLCFYFDLDINAHMSYVSAHCIPPCPLHNYAYIVFTHAICIQNPHCMQVHIYIVDAYANKQEGIGHYVQVPYHIMDWSTSMDQICVICTPMSILRSTLLCPVEMA